jgi:hypothetical protein
MSDPAQTLLLFLVMAAAALAVGWRLGRTATSRTPSTPAAPGPDPERDRPAPSASEGPDDEKKRRKDKRPKDITALAAKLNPHYERSPTPGSFLASERFQKALAALDALSLSSDDLLGLLSHDNPLVVVLAMRAAPPDDLDLPRQRTRLLALLQSGSPLVRAVALDRLENAHEAPLLGPVVGRLDSDWENPASCELLEAFLRRRLAAEDSLEIASDLKDRDPWDQQLIRDVV